MPIDPSLATRMVGTTGMTDRAEAERIPRPQPDRSVLGGRPSPSRGVAVLALAAAMLLGPSLPVSALEDAPEDARLVVELEAALLASFANSFAPTTTSGWQIEDFVDSISYNVNADYDPFTDVELTIENTTDAPLPIQMRVQASMEPQFADAPLSTMAEIMLIDGTSQTDPDGSVSFVRSETRESLVDTFLQAFDGQVRSFGFFETELFSQDLLSSGIHQDEAAGVIGFDATDIFFPAWNETVLQVEGTLSPGDSIAIAGRFEVNVVPEPARLAGQVVALLSLGGLARRLRWRRRRRS